MFVRLRILDTLHTAFVTHAIYHYAISNFGNVIALLKPTWYVAPLFGPKRS